MGPVAQVGKAPLLQQAAGAAFGLERRLPSFAAAVLADPQVAGLIQRLHLALEDPATSVLERESRSLHGLTRTLIANLIIGVTEGYQKSLEVVGTGYRVQSKGSGVEFALGYSHPITVEPPAGISFEVEGTNKLTVKGIDKQAVGEVAANIRKLRKPEPYKGKGVRYAGEVVRRKAGKAGK